MQRRLLGPVVLWLFLALGVTWVIVRYGVGAVTALSGIVVALLASAPFAPKLRRWWSRSGAPSTTEQVDEAALVLRQTVRRQWTEEAGRRHQFSDDDRMAVRWELLAGSRNRDGLPDNGSIETLIEAYAARPWPLIVVGDAGCGKTGLCVLLTLELAARESQRRIPVVFQLSSWNPVENFEKWLLRRLGEDYEFLGDEARWGATAAEELLNRERLLPILDGLDELSEEAGAAVLRTIRESPVFVSPFVLTSRTAEFAAAGGRAIGGKAVIGLLPMDRPAVTGYLRDVFSTDAQRWQPVLDDLTRAPDGLLATTLTKPLMLFLARKTYESHTSDPAELLDSNRFPTGELIENHLLDRFVPTVFARQDAPPRDNPSRASGRWGPERAQTTLAFLARYLDTIRTDGDSGATDLSWWQLHQLVPFAVFFFSPVLLGAGACCLLCWMIFGLFGQPLAGIVFGLAIGLLGGAAMGVAGPQPPLRFVPRVPRRADLGLRPLVQDAVFGLIGVVSGGFIVGTLVNVTYGVVSGLIFGLTFALVRRFTRPTEPKEAVTPIGVLRSDRVAVAYGWLLGAIIGAGVSVFLALTATGLTEHLVVHLDTFRRGLLAAGMGVLLGGIGLGMLVQATSSWGHFLTTRVWLWLTGATPFRLMSFLDDAHKLGVLRLTGPHFQFRHALLQQRLAEDPVLTAAPTPA